MNTKRQSRIRYWTGCARIVQGQTVRTVTGLPCFTLTEARQEADVQRHNAIFHADPKTERCTDRLAEWRA
jgi:hypothetical protein